MLNEVGGGLLMSANVSFSWIALWNISQSHIEGIQVQEVLIGQ